MMLLIVNNKVVGSGYSEGWLVSEVSIVLGDGGGFICEDGKKVECEMGDVFMSSDCIVEMMMDGNVVCVFDSEDNIKYMGMSEIDMEDEL